MSLEYRLKVALENEERRTVGGSFGGSHSGGRALSFSVSSVRQFLLLNINNNDDELAILLNNFNQLLIESSIINNTLDSLIRFSFLIELTNLSVGSTKMKTRWLSGLILMPQLGSFEPIRGEFIPGNDPRASTFEECVLIFKNCIQDIIEKISSGNITLTFLTQLFKVRSVPYEFLFDYLEPSKPRVHTPDNIVWIFNEDISWLVKVRPILYSVLQQSIVNKIKTKTFKTDRALTGRDKTNRAKRWEVLFGDFQYASLTDCWSVERKLLSELIGFDNFPQDVIQLLNQNGLVSGFNHTRCPVTLERLNYLTLLNDVVHGRAEYQVGHLYPLKRGGYHNGVNVCWQSANGNRIQGDLTIDETVNLLDSIFNNRSSLNQYHQDFISKELEVRG
ncbi:hypothetical protein R2S03_14990 [Hafnia alvei]|uniref:hypothetical protein n=1 Tax=Proteus vulgaris TaxID=585 RepID=UPI00299E34CF|nr:hypothetical protein [Proteus vulgaris]WOO48766.1 hypothetical protein R2S03_14990 [Hafnia alvei]WPF03232.1 hypothetical protein SB028_13825 [Proteus vulgaris]